MILQLMAMHRTCQLALSAHLVESVSPTARWTQRARQRSHLSQTLHHLFARSPPACWALRCTKSAPLGPTCLRDVVLPGSPPAAVAKGGDSDPSLRAAGRPPPAGPARGNGGIKLFSTNPEGGWGAHSYFGYAQAMHRLCTSYAQAMHDSSPARKASHDSSPARRLSDGGHIHTPFVRVVRLPGGQWV